MASYEEYMEKLKNQYGSNETDKTGKTGTTGTNKNTSTSTNSSTNSKKTSGRRSTSSYDSYMSSLNEQYGSDVEINDAYIQSYFAKANKFLGSAEQDFGNLNYNTSSSLNRKRQQTMRELNEGRFNISQYLKKNKDALDPEYYESMMSMLDEVGKASMQTSKAFHSANYIYSQYDTEYEYNAALLDSDSFDSDSVTARQNAYQMNTAHIAELEEQIAAVESASSTADAVERQMYDPDGTTSYLETTGLKKLNEELEALVAANTRYERGQKILDDNFHVTQAEDFEEASAKRDFQNPTREELDIYDIRMNGDQYTDAEGNTYDVFGDLVDEDYYTQFSQPEIADRLGAFLNASDVEKNQALATVSEVDSSWARPILDGLNGSWDQLEESEISIYYYLLNTSGKEAADKFLDDMETELNRRSTSKMQEEISGATGLEKLALNIASVPMNILGGMVGFADDALHVLQGEDINPYSGAHAMSNMSQAVRTSTAEDLDKLTGSKTVLGMSLGDAYQAVMSGADSMAGALTLGATGYGWAMGMGAASSEAKELYEKGASREQIVFGSLLAGAAEGVFEKFSIEHFLTIGDSKSIFQIVKNTLLQGGVEASEEVATEIANTITDALVMGSQSDFSLSMQMYLDKGKSESEAQALALMDVGMNIWKAGMGGFISGGGMGSIGSIASYAGYQSDMKQSGGEIMEAGGYENLKALAMEVANEGVATGAEGRLGKFTDRTDSKVQRIADAGSTAATEQSAGAAKSSSKVSVSKHQQNSAARSVGKLADRVDTVRRQQNTADIQASLEANGMDTREAKKAAKALSEAVDLQNFSSKDIQKFMGDSRVTEAIQELANDPNSSVNKRNLKHTLAKLGVRVTDKATASDSGETTAETSKRSAYVENPSERVLEASTEGKTVISETGETVQIKEISSIQNGDMVLRLDDGRTVNAKDVEYASADEALVYESVLRLGTNAAAANSILKTWSPESGVSAESFARGVEEAYRYGQYNIPVQEMMERGSFASELTEEQRATAYKLGQIFTGKSVAKQQTAATAATKKATAGKSSVAGKVHFEGDTSGLTARQTTSLSALETVAEALGVQIYVFESEVDAAGNRVGDNGWYDPKDGSIHIDLYAGANGQGTMLFTLAHELTHFIKQWSPAKFKVLANFLMKEYGKQGVSVDALVQAQIQKAADDGRTIDYDTAYEEVVADSMETMLADGQVVDKLAKLKQQDQTLWQKIKDFISELVAKIRKVYAGLQADSVEGRYVAEMKDAIEQIQEMFTDAVADAGTNFQAAMESVIEAKAKPISENEIMTDGAVVTDGDGKKYSIRSMKADIAEGQMFEDLKNYCGWSQQQVDELRQNLTDLVAYMTPFRDILDMNESYGREGRRFSPYKPNSDPLYKISMDFSTLCSKRLLTQYVIENLQLRENRPMSAEEQMAIRDMLNEYRKVEKGLQVACAMCYVEAARLKSPKQIQKWMDDPATQMKNYFADKNPEYANHIREKQAEFKESRGYARNATKKDMSAKDVRELNNIRPRLRSQYELSAEEAKIVERATALPHSTYLTAGNLASLSESDPTIYAAYTSFVRSATRSKSLETDEPYYYGDSRRDNGNGIVVTDSFIESVNRENGMRFSSWSDWRIQHLLDYITAVIDNSVRGAAMHGYTKFGDEVRVLGKTGVMFNMSGVAGTQTGLNEDGSLSFSSTESIDVNEAIQLREEFPDTAGLQSIGVGDEHIVALLRSDIIDYVIPYHVSGLNAALRRMANIYGWKDYTSTQHAANDKNIKREDAVDQEHWHEEPVFSEFFVGYDTGMTGIEAMRASANRYVEMCADRGLKPKFEQFVNEDGYWKLLIDRKMINQKTGELIQQRAVTPTFDFKTIKEVVDSYVQNYDSGLESRALNYIVDNWDSIPKRIRDLKKQGSSTAKRVSKNVDILANETLAAQPLVETSSLDAEATGSYGDGIKHSARVTDKKTLDFLNNQETITTYKTMQLVDGKLYPPMAARTDGKYEDYSVLGSWEQATEHPELIKNGNKYKLDKGKGQRGIEAAYNPYMHSSNLVLNDQFSGAYARDNLVTVECEVPVSELTSGYHAQYAKDSVGWHAWHTGTVAGNLRKTKGIERQVFLSRWIKPVRIVPDAEVAAMYKELLDGTDIAVPDNVVTPSLLQELKSAGVNIVESGRVKHSGRGYTYSDLISKPDMHVTLVDGTVPTNRADVVAEAKKNAAQIGKVNPKTGSVSVHVEDIGVDVLLGTDGLKHGLRRTKDPQNEANYIVTLKAGEIIQNSIRINEATPKKQNASGSYVLIGAARRSNGDMYIVRSVVNQFNNQLASMDVLYAINAKKEPAALNAPRSAATPLSVTSSTLSIADLLDYVNRYFPDVLPEDVYKHYGHTQRPSGDLGASMLFQDRETDSVSNRSLLANALESAAQNDIERTRLEEYRGKIDMLNAEEQKLSELRAEIKELSFAKGPKDTKRIRSLQFDAKQTANRINTIDKQLLRLEAAKPLQDVLQREKRMAYKRAERRGKEALEAYRERAAKKQREIINRYQESRAKGVESRHKTAMRHKIQNVVNELNNLLLHSTKDRHVPIQLQKAVAEALDAINMDTVTAEERIAKLEQDLMKAKSPDKIQEISRKIDHIREMGDKMSNRLKALKEAYDEFLNSDDPLIANSHDEGLSAHLMTLIVKVGDTPLRNMTMEQLEAVYDVYKIVLTTVRNANKAFKTAKNESIASLGNRTIEEVEKVGGKHDRRAAAMDGIKRFGWNNLKPVYAFQQIGSDTLSMLFENVRAGEDTWARDITEAKEFSDSMQKKYGYKKWDFKKQYRFKSTAGVDFSLTIDQIMALYAYSKRKQADDHLEKGGFVYDSNVEVTEKKNGIPVKYKVNTATAHNLSKEILAEITGVLTDNQKAFADEMQGYLSTTMGEKGNEVALEMYGIKLFKEKFYFPLKSAKQFLFEQNETAGEVKVKNSGFTKEVKAHASNPVILTGFMDAWANHVNDMSMYHAFVLPLEDFNRVFNYKTPRAGSQNQNSVKEFIQNAYGPQAVNYVSQLLKDLNGGARSDPRESPGKALVGSFKKAAVFASASVVIQQPSAVARALALINPKYFDFNPKLIQHKKLWAEVKKYAPVAIIKEMGHFDTDMGMSTVDYIKGDKTLMDRADDVLAWAPAMADELTWCHIWTAVKRETLAKNRGMNIKSDEFLQKVGKRFTEVIVKTQVYDSVLSRSANMRSKSLYMNMLTSFMAEPTTTINMLQDALINAKRGNKKASAKTIGAVTASIILNSVLVSFVYASRDDDEDETWLEKYASSLAVELVDGFNPLTYFPIVKDVWSLLQGYDVERADMSLLSTASEALTNLVKVVAVDTDDMDEEELAEHNQQVFDSVWGLVDATASLTGIPIKNIRRDVMAAINTYTTVNNGLSNNKTSFWNEIKESVKNTLPVWGWLPDEKKGDKLYEAIVSGDTTYLERIEGLYDDEAAIESARIKSLRENDPRILEAAQAEFNNNPGERVRIARQIIAEGNFVQDDVVRAINAEVNKLELAARGYIESEQKSPKFYTMENYYDAVMMNDSATADEAKEYFISDRLALGDSEEDAQSSFESSFTSTVKGEYLEGNIGQDTAMDLLTTYGGSSEGDAETHLKKWHFEETYGYSWDMRDNAYRLGDISMDELVDASIDIDGDADSIAEFLYEEQEIDASAAIDMLVTYSDMSQADATVQVSKWQFKLDYGYSYADKRDAYIAGKISSADLKTSLIEIGDLTEEEADEKIAVYDWLKNNPGRGLDENAVAAYIKPIEELGVSVEDYGVTPETFADYRREASKCKGVDADGDGETDSGSKKAQILLVINSLPISYDQKNALYFLNGWAASRLYEAPWT